MKHFLPNIGGTEKKEVIVPTLKDVTTGRIGGEQNYHWSIRRKYEYLYLHMEVKWTTGYY